MTELNEFQREELRKFGLNNVKSLMDIIDILPEFIDERITRRLDYELTVRKHEVRYESYDALDRYGDPYVLNSFSTTYDKKCNSLLDCAFEMLMWCLNKKLIKSDTKK